MGQMGFVLHSKYPPAPGRDSRQCEEQGGTWASCFLCKGRFFCVMLPCRSSAPLGSAPEVLLLLFSTYLMLESLAQ